MGDEDTPAAPTDPIFLESDTRLKTWKHTLGPSPWTIQGRFGSTQCKDAIEARISSPSLLSTELCERVRAAGLPDVDPVFVSSRDKSSSESTVKLKPRPPLSPPHGVPYPHPTRSPISSCYPPISSPSKSSTPTLPTPPVLLLDLMTHPRYPSPISPTLRLPQLQPKQAPYPPQSHKPTGLSR